MRCASCYEVRVLLRLLQQQVREVQLAFESGTPTTITSATIATEHTSATVSSIASQGTNLVRIPVPQSVQRGVRHTLTVTLATSSSAAPWKLSGIKFLYRAYQPRGNK